MLSDISDLIDGRAWIKLGNRAHPQKSPELVPTDDPFLSRLAFGAFGPGAVVIDSVLHW